MRGIFAPTAAIIGFSCLLTFIFILYQPTVGPGISQRLGWQAWDAVATVDYFDKGPSTVTQPGEEEEAQPTPGNGEGVEGTDWWETSSTQPWNTTDDIESYPLDVWAPLLPHDTGRTCDFHFVRDSIQFHIVSEISISRCMMPMAFVGDLCNPESTDEQDAIKGKWVRVDRDLNKQSGLWTLVCTTILCRSCHNLVKSL